MEGRRNMMKAVRIEESTDSLYIGEMDKPVISEDELLVRVKATALNRADLDQRKGNYPPPKGASEILGLEVSGIVEQIGENAHGWKKGDRVFALVPGGGYAEYAVVSAGMAMPMPESFSFEQAAAIPEVFLTAYLNLFQLGGLKEGQTVLIHAGASGVGTAAIQLAHASGTRVIITAGSEEKRELCRSLGAEAAIDYKAGPFASKVEEITGGEGVNLVFDFVGAPYWEQNLQLLKTDGRLILISVLGGSKVKDLDLTKILFKRLQIIGSTLRSKPVDQKINLTKRFSDFAMPLFESGQIKPIIDSVFDWKDVDQAHDWMANNKNAGKIVLRVQG